MRVASPAICLMIVLAAACGGSEVIPPPPETILDPSAEAVSLLGMPLYRPEFPPQRQQQLEQDLAAARTAYDADSGDEMANIWLGRRTAYLSRYLEAVEIFSTGLEHHPDSFKLLRHRGHRYITMRRFDDAVADLQRAAELSGAVDDAIEPDGIPNRNNTPLSTTQFNIWYHLGLAHYLQGDYEAALAAYRICMEYSINPDLLVATTDWLYMTLRRLGLHAEAEAVLEPISANMEIIENASYHRRLLMYRGEIEPDELLDLGGEDDPDAGLTIATQGYGVANWYLANDDPETARDLFLRIIEGSNWAAFGYIAAEADLARIPPLE